jgi:ankyrin repeat protein
MYAAGFDKKEAVELLLSKGANIEAANKVIIFK